MVSLEPLKGLQERRGRACSFRGSVGMEQRGSNAGSAAAPEPERQRPQPGHGGAPLPAGRLIESRLLRALTPKSVTDGHTRWPPNGSCADRRPLPPRSAACVKLRGETAELCHGPPGFPGQRWLPWRAQENKGRAPRHCCQGCCPAAFLQNTE